jgi:hypothetical protein
MHDLTKSVLIVNRFLGLLLGSNFSTPIEHTLNWGPPINYFF